VLYLLADGIFYHGRLSFLRYLPVSGSRRMPLRFQNSSSDVSRVHMAFHWSVLLTDCHSSNSVTPCDIKSKTIAI
jgi:hypothetical protein